MCAKINDEWHVKPIFWLPANGLAEKSRKDRVPYDVWHKQGFLETTPGKAIEYSYVAQLLHGLWQQLDIRAVAFDRYNYRHLKPWLEQAGFGALELERFVEFGQGFISMSPALREFEAALLNQKIRHGMHPVLTMNAANAATVADPAGNRKLSKSKSRGRIDGMVSLAMALSVATTATITKPFASIWDSQELADAMA
jgi:phage terminase large subunit-like protein